MGFGLWLTLMLSVVLETQTIDDGTLAVAVASCDHVLPEHCRAAPLAEPAAFHVLLAADPELSSVQIDIHREGREGPLSLSRTLALDVAASREERARTLGLVIAAHVLAQTPPPRAPPPPVIPPTVEHAHWSLDLAGIVGSALDVGKPRLGGMLRGTWRPPRVPLGIVASVRGAARPERDPRLWWLDVTAGLLTHAEWGRIGAEARLEVVAQHFAAHVEDQKERTFRGGGLLGGELHLRLRGPNWLFAGVEGAVLGPPVRIRLRGAVEGRQSPFTWSALLGFRRAW